MEKTKQRTRHKSIKTQKQFSYLKLLSNSTTRKGILSWNKWRSKNEETRLNLVGFDFSARDISEINLGNANLSGAKFSGSLLKGAILSGSCLNGADLFGTTCDDLTAIGATFRNAIFCHASLQEADLSFCDLTECDFRGADMTGGNIGNSTISGANFQEVSCDYIYVDSAWINRLPKRRILLPGELSSLLLNANTTKCLQDRIMRKSSLKGHAFVSYVKEDAEIVLQLVEELETNGVDVWMDKMRIEPGMLWRTAIKKAIRNGAFFLACFSKNYQERNVSYMNEELNIAREQIRKMKGDSTWFIPLKVTECDIPDLEIASGIEIVDYQWVDLSREWSKGIRSILKTIIKNTI